MDRTSYRNRPAQRSEAASSPEPSPHSDREPITPMATKSYRKETPRRPASKLPWFVAVVILVLVLIAGWYFFLRPAALVDGGKFQAVFLSNGQVYFGKLSFQSGEYVKLKDVFYLQKKSDTSNTTPQSAASQDATDVELIKLGNEIHGPADEMLVAKDQILFFENLKSDGKVSQTITNYQNQHK
jgi:hypothetical protein